MTKQEMMNELSKCGCTQIGSGVFDKRIWFFPPKKIGPAFRKIVKEQTVYRNTAPTCMPGGMNIKLEDLK